MKLSFRTRLKKDSGRQIGIHRNQVETILDGELSGPNYDLLSALILAGDFVGDPIAVLGDERPLGVDHVSRPSRGPSLGGGVVCRRHLLEEGIVGVTGLAPTVERVLIGLVHRRVAMQAQGLHEAAPAQFSDDVEFAGQALESFAQLIAAFDYRSLQTPTVTRQAKEEQEAAAKKSEPRKSRDMDRNSVGATRIANRQEEFYLESNKTLP